MADAGRSVTLVERPAGQIWQIAAWRPTDALALRPRFAERLTMRGIELSNDLFTANRGLE